MRLEEIYNVLNGLSPFELQASWDNSGLILGSYDQDITTIVLSIDIDEELIESAEEGSLIITHHPLIFSGIKSMDFATYPSKLLAKMIEKKIANVAMHTNFDQTHLNRYVAEKVLGKKVLNSDAYLIYFDENKSFEELRAEVANTFGLTHVKSVIAHDRIIKRVALCTGSGASMIREIDADLFLTGDIKYHDAMEAKALGVNMIDIGHFESECFFGEILAENLKILGLTVIISSSKNPFTYL
ncbi:MAG: Nif3-like dinuclear metal center hexameric protein [Helicobacteraceae bacterium]|jgi:dinuclear metal center YbgI/SA1388 family protein|nr:Nif3-like dinuclear metal center hexameric protein [Helicobacteraceae bacterium]